MMKFTKECSFRAALKNTDSRHNPLSEMGYIRADWKNGHWWSNGFPVHKKLENPQRIDELNRVAEAIYDKAPDMKALRAFCRDSATPLNEDGDYEVFYEGTHCNYFIHLCSRENDYNLRVHALVKEVAMNE